MGVKTICLVIFDLAEAAWLTEKTCELATSLDAHVIGIHPFIPVIFAGGLGAEPVIFPSINEWELSESAKIQDVFQDRTSKEDLRAEFRRQDSMYGAETFLLSSARGADLVVMGTNASDTRSPDDRSLAERFIRNIGRPVLVLSPEASLAAPPKRLVVGWSETREATRAAHDALLLAAPGASIELVSLLARPSDNPAGLDSRDDFAAALDRRGFKATTSDRISNAEDRAEALLSFALEQGADLLVTGAFGHSQVYDFVIGAVTRDLLKKATLPILMSK